ncbi:hypothetical protein D3C76_792380 [compost metagenome]
MQRSVIGRKKNRTQRSTFQVDTGPPIDVDRPFPVPAHAGAHHLQDTALCDHPDKIGRGELATGQVSLNVFQSHARNVVVEQPGVLTGDIFEQRAVLGRDVEWNGYLLLPHRVFFRVVHHNVKISRHDEVLCQPAPGLVSRMFDLLARVKIGVR